MARKRTYDTTIWMPLYIGDTLAETLQLTTEQFGALMLLTMHYWRRQGPLPDDDVSLATVCRMPVDAFSKIKPTLTELFEIKDGQWVSDDLDFEIVKAKNNKAMTYERAMKAVEARYGKKYTRDPNKEKKT